MAHESLSIESLYDFLYLDNIKIKSFYAQLTGNGALNSYKITNSTSTTESKEATIGVPTITGGKLFYAETPSRSNEYMYDAIPTMPREMIDKLDELGFILRELKPENGGKLVLLKGKLGVTDVNTLKDLIEPALKFENYNQANEITDIKKKRAFIANIESAQKLLIDMINQIPYALEARLIVDGQEIWMTLNKEEMVGNPNDINLKNGSFLFGDYYVLGVLDAVPYDNYVHDSGVQEDFRVAMIGMIDALKTLFGRTESSYGMTPIAIFRNIEIHRS